MGLRFTYSAAQTNASKFWICFVLKASQSKMSVLKKQRRLPCPDVRLITLAECGQRSASNDVNMEVWRFLNRIFARIRDRAKTARDIFQTTDFGHSSHKANLFLGAGVHGKMIEADMGPLGMTSVCTGACGLMSSKASACSFSKTVWFGISPRRILAKMFWSS